MEQNTIMGHDFLKSLGRTRLRPGGGVMTDWLLGQIKMDKSTKVLEVACNRGDNLIRIYSENKCEIIGIDLDEDVVDVARENLKILGLEDKIEVLAMDATDLKFEDESFDVVINEAMLTMMSDEKKELALKNYHRVLKQGGFLLTHDVAIEGYLEAKRREVSKFANTNVKPLTVEGWNELFLSNGFKPFAQRSGNMLLMDRDTIIKDEGPMVAAQIFRNGMKEENKKRFQMMLEKNRNPIMDYIVIASQKIKR